ncbi:MAG: 5-bromo-4-chloroindolyl phosphate hydrolysis family protein [Paracoccaceae bacterium]
MAQRYGGKYSPDGSRPAPGLPDPAGQPPRNPFDGKRVSRVGVRSNLLFLAAILLLLPLAGGNPAGFVLAILSCGVMLLSAWLTREGLLAEEAYEARTVARRPAIPRKIFGSVLTGIALGLAGFAHYTAPLYPVLFGFLGTALHFGAFGPDPLRDKGMEGVDSFQTERVARAVDEAERNLSAMKDAILRANDRQLSARVDRFAQTARTMFRTVENDPRDLTSARKYLSVYLTGARDATVKFADLYAQNRDPAARADYESLLTDLETNFASRTQALLSDNRTDLDVEIAVLRDRLKLET